MILDQVLELLPQLDPDELVMVRQRASALAALDGVQEEAEEDWLLNGIIAQLQDMGLGDLVPPGFKILNRRQFHGYLPKSEKLRKTIEKTLPGTTRLNRLALGKLLAKCLAAKVASFRPVTFHALLQHAELSLAALDAAFPGYLSAGLLPVILRGRFPRAAG
jgi:hypothetical protein